MIWQQGSLENYYTLLGFEPKDGNYNHVTSPMIRKARKELLLIVHPDKAQSIEAIKGLFEKFEKQAKMLKDLLREKSTDNKEELTDDEIFQLILDHASEISGKINNACDVLSDEKLRSQYDEDLATSTDGKANPVSQPHAPSELNPYEQEFLEIFNGKNNRLDKAFGPYCSDSSIWQSLASDPLKLSTLLENKTWINRLIEDNRRLQELAICIYEASKFQEISLWNLPPALREKTLAMLNLKQGKNDTGTPLKNIKSAGLFPDIFTLPIQPEVTSECLLTELILSDFEFVEQRWKLFESNIEDIVLRELGARTYIHPHLPAPTAASSAFMYRLIVKSSPITDKALSLAALEHLENDNKWEKWVNKHITGKVLHDLFGNEQKYNSLFFDLKQTSYVKLKEFLSYLTDTETDTDESLVSIFRFVDNAGLDVNTMSEILENLPSFKNGEIGLALLWDISDRLEELPPEIRTIMQGQIEVLANAGYETKYFSAAKRYLLRHKRDITPEKLLTIFNSFNTDKRSQEVIDSIEHVHLSLLLQIAKIFADDLPPNKKVDKCLNILANRLKELLLTKNSDIFSCKELPTLFVALNHIITFAEESSLDHLLPQLIDWKTTFPQKYNTNLLLWYLNLAAKKKENNLIWDTDLVAILKDRKIRHRLEFRHIFEFDAASKYVCSKIINQELDIWEIEPEESILYLSLLFKKSSAQKSNQFLDAVQKAGKISKLEQIVSDAVSHKNFSFLRDGLVRTNDDLSTLIVNTLTERQLTSSCLEGLFKDDIKLLQQLISQKKLIVAELSENNKKAIIDFLLKEINSYSTEDRKTTLIDTLTSYFVDETCQRLIVDELLLSLPDSIHFYNFDVIFTKTAWLIDSLKTPNSYLREQCANYLGSHSMSPGNNSNLKLTERREKIIYKLSCLVFSEKIKFSELIQYEAENKDRLSEILFKQELEKRAACKSRQEEVPNIPYMLNLLMKPSASEHLREAWNDPLWQQLIMKVLTEKSWRHNGDVLRRKVKAIADMAHFCHNLREFILNPLQEESDRLDQDRKWYKRKTGEKHQLFEAAQKKVSAIVELTLEQQKKCISNQKERDSQEKEIRKQVRESLAELAADKDRVLSAHRNPVADLFRASAPMLLTAPLTLPFFALCLLVPPLIAPMVLLPTAAAGIGIKAGFFRPKSSKVANELLRKINSDRYFGPNIS